jgi:hypothetical protein
VASADVQRMRKEEPALVAPQGLLQPPAAPPSFPLFDGLLGCMVAAGQGIEALCFILNLTRQALDEHIVRLGLPTPHDRPLRKPGPKGWSLLDTIRLIVWWFAGVHSEIIGPRLERRRSANAVRAKARRLGLPRRLPTELHKPDPASLRDPDPGVIASWTRRGPVGGGLSPVGEIAVQPLARFDLGVPDSISRVEPQGSAKATRKAHAQRKGQTARQRELPLLAVVGGTAANLAENMAPAEDRSCEAVLSEAVPAEALPPIPKTEAEVDLSGDLTWFKRLNWTNPLTNRAAVWTGFMLLAGGLHYKEAAKRLGIPEGSFRSFRTRADIPVDRDRWKMGQVFDEEAARITLARSGYELRPCMSSDNWFWGSKTSKGVRLSPPFRRRERIIGQRSNVFTIVTRTMLDAERRSRQSAPFANSGARVCA